MKQQKRQYTNSNKDPTGATELVYYGLKCDTKPLDHKSYPIPNGQTPALTSPPSVARIEPEGDKRDCCPMGDEEVEARGRDSLMDPGMGNGVRPRRKSLTLNSTIPRP